ncbi:hypothetical protein D3C85_1517930 [compost metagenome]
MSGRTTRATVLDRHIRQDHAHFAGSQPGRAVGLVLLAPLVFQRRKVVGDEATDAVGEWNDVVVEPGRTVVIQHGEYLENLLVSARHTPSAGVCRECSVLRWRRGRRRRPGSGRRRSWLPAGTA